MGSLSVIALMSLLLLQVATGLFSDDEIANAGPLTVWASESMVSMTTHWHKGLGKGLVLLLIAIHVGAILWYFVKKKENLIRAMLWGDKSSASPATSSLDRPLDWLKALLCLALAAALVFVLINAVPASL
jgi:cytochrome b